MDLKYSDEQCALRDGVDRVLAEHRSGDMQRVADDDDAKALWRRGGELGWTALAIPEEYGGLGGDDVDLSILMEAFGRHRVVSPLFATIVLGATLIERVAYESQKKRLLVEIAEGRLALGLAYLDQADAPPTIAERVSGDDQGQVCIRGVKTLVLSAPYADQIIVSARAGVDAASLEFFLVDRDSPKLSHREYRTLTGERAWDIHFDGVIVPDDSRLGGIASSDALVPVLDKGAVAVTFDALGAAEALLSATVAYAHSRQQFGQSLFSFQTVRHRLADMAVACQEARSISLVAALSAKNERRRSCTASAAKFKALNCARFVAEQAIQIHGGMGMSEDLAVGSYFRRILADEILFDWPEVHLTRYAGMSRGTTSDCAGKQ